MDSNSELIMYTTEDDLTKIDVTFDDDTVWLTQEQMAGLFQKSKSAINEHIKNIYAEGELQQEGTMKNSEIPNLLRSRQISITLMQSSPSAIVSKRSVAYNSGFGQHPF